MKDLWSDEHGEDNCGGIDRFTLSYNLHEDIRRLKEEIDNLHEALVYVAFASHSTPLHMLPKGIILGGNDTVEVKLNAGVTVTAKHVI